LLDGSIHDGEHIIAEVEGDALSFHSAEYVQ
jgi:hypothetical protein